MEESLRALLTSDATLADRLGANVYWNTIAQGATGDAVVMYLISGAGDYHLQGPDRLVSNRVQIDARAEVLTDAWAIGRAIKSRLSGYRGTESGTYFSGIFLLSERQNYENSGNGSQGFHRVSLDFQVWSRAA